MSKRRSVRVAALVLRRAALVLAAQALLLTVVVPRAARGRDRAMPGGDGEQSGVRPVGDAVNHPTHYNAHPSGVECIDIVEHMNFCQGNAIKYLWRADDKGAPLQDLEKARWYVDREIKRRKKQAKKQALH